MKTIRTPLTAICTLFVCIGLLTIAVGCKEEDNARMPDPCGDGTVEPLELEECDDGMTLAVGTTREDSSNATGVNPGPAAEADNSALGAGAAYIFE